MTPPARTLAALTSAAALTITGISPASAASWAHDDAVGDVESYTYEYDENDTETESGPDPRPANTNTDITRLSVRHNERRVVLKTTLRDITPASGVMVYQIRTGTRKYFALQRLGTDRENWAAFDLFRNNESRFRCPNVRHDVDRSTEKAVVNIPRSCLGDPRAVRVGAGAFKFRATRTKETYLTDDALKDAQSGGRLALSPRIRRG